MKRAKRKSRPRADKSPPTTEHRSRRRTLALAGLGFSLLFFLALDLAVGSLADFDRQRSFRSSHSYYHHGLQPNQHTTTRWGTHSYEMATNSLGFRDRSVRQVPSESSSTRVVLIGDSMIEGLGIDFDETVAGLLESRWSRHNVEVLNASVVSYSPRLYDLRIRHLTEEVGLEFDHLVVFIDISDIQDELFYEAFQPERSRLSVRDWWRRHSLIANVIERMTVPETGINTEFTADADTRVWMEGTEGLRTQEGDPEAGRWEWTIDDEIYEEWGAKGMALARKHMARLHELCREHDIEMTVVVYPSPVQIFTNDVDSRQVLSWREFCEEFGIRFINLFPSFIDYSFSGPEDVYEEYFIDSDTHWNAAGHTLVADRIDEVLRTSLTPE